jgi:hypothetical protein
LYAYPDAIPFYTKLGFRYDSDFTVLKGTGTSSFVDARVTQAQRRDFKQIVEFDKNCFGAVRRKVLEPILTDIGNFCYVVFEDNRLIGFLAAALYGKTAELGPLVCSQRRSDIAISLISSAINRLRGYEVVLCLRKKEVAVIDMLTKYGFHESFNVSRMFFGTPVSRDCIYASESLERG